MSRIAKILDRLPLEFFLIALIAGAYFRVPQLWYAYDDGQYILGTPQISHGLNAPDIKWALTATHAANWHPLTWISYMVDTQLAGMSARQFHTTNLLLHIASTLLLFLMLNRLTKSVWKSVFVAALFGVHPLHVESVAWITERKDVLSTLFWFLTFWAYIGYAERRRVGSYLLVVFFFVLGLMSKPMLVTLPVTLLLLDFWPLGRLQLGKGGVPLKTLMLEKVPLFALTAASCAVTYFVQRSGGAFGAVSFYPMHIRIMNALNSGVMYIWKMIWPMNLAICYPHPGAGLPIWQAAFAGIFLLAVTVLVIRSARTRPYLAFGWLWYIITLIPVIGIVQVGNQAMADRYTYIPLIGLFVMIAWGIPDLLGKGRDTASEDEEPRVRAFAPALGMLGLVLILSLAMLTRMQVRYWVNNLTLFKHAAEVTANNAEAHTNYGAALMIIGDVKGALAQHQMAVKIDQTKPLMYMNLGGALTSLGRDDEALAAYQNALDLEPTSAAAHTEMAVILVKRQDYYGAQEHFDRALELNPEYANAHNEYANYLDSIGQSEEAMMHYDEAIAINPEYADAYYNKGVVLHKMGMFPDAIECYKSAVRYDPAKASAHKNLATALYMVGRYAEAWNEVYATWQCKDEPNPGFLAALTKKMPDPGS